MSSPYPANDPDSLHGFAAALVFLLRCWYDTVADLPRRGWLREHARRFGVPFLDMSEPIHEVGREKAFIQNNWHLNPYGYRIVAEHILAFLAEEVGVD